MAARSAGILMYKRRAGELLVLLVHPGGPFWARRDFGAWSIPKGEYDAAEDARAAALREFEEELGIRPTGEPAALGEIVQKSGKRVVAFALEGELDVAKAKSNSCDIEWPPRSGRVIAVPEIDRAEWLTLAQARAKMMPAQQPLLDRLLGLLGEAADAAASARPKGRGPTA